MEDEVILVFTLQVLGLCYTCRSLVWVFFFSVIDIQDRSGPIGYGYCGE